MSRIGNRRIRNLLGYIFVFCTLITMAKGQAQGLSDLSGEDIVAVMQTMGDKCPATSSDGLNWAPVHTGVACGGTPRCDFPNTWCAFKLKADQTPDMTSLSCKPLSDTCKQAFKDLFPGGASGGTPAPGGATTPAGAATTLATSPAAMTEATPAATPAPAETTTSSESTTTTSAAAETTTTSAAAPTEAPAGGSSPAGGSAGTTGAAGGMSSPSSGECCDYHEFCCFWAADGECDKNKAFMLQICQKSCGSCGCGGDASSCKTNVDSKCSGSDVKPGSPCPCNSGHLVNKDWNPACGGWAGKGACDKNPSYMKAMCKKSCNVCQ